jgi:hypothetical protein
VVKRNRQGIVMIELVVAIGILTAALLPLAYSYANEQHQCHLVYIRAIAMELVDGQMEVLAAGRWHEVAGDGTYDYPVNAGTVRNLPPGKFTLTVRGRQLRLEWRPNNPRFGQPVIREATAR